MTVTKNRAASFLTGVFLLLASLSQAAPFAKTISFTQPDGRGIALWGEGDDFHADFETLDGYTVVFDPGARAYVYAALSADGTELEPTALTVGRDNPAALGLAKHLRITVEAARQKAQERRQEWDARVGVSQRWQKLKDQKALRDAALNDGPILMAPPSFETIGDKIGLCLLIDFDDDPATIAQAEIVEFCNGDDYTGHGNNGSVKKYFADVSNGQLNFTQVVTLYIRIPNSVHPKSFYNDWTKDAGENARQMIADAVSIMKALPNYETEILPTFANLTTRMANENIFGVEFDEDFEAVAACSVFYAGGNGGVWAAGLWPHYSMLDTPIELSPGGLRLLNYQVSNIGDALEIATFAHENSHMLCGFPDIYDYDYDSTGGAGLFCLMNSGTLFGNNPPQHCAYLKYAAGWATTIEVTDSDFVDASVASEPGHPDFNKFYRFQKPGTPTEYYLFENRQQSGRDANIPGSGVAVWHIDERGNRDDQSMVYNTAHKNYECTLVQADNLWDLQNYVNYGDDADLYYEGNPSAAYANVFKDTSTPKACWWDGSLSYMVAEKFSPNSPEMTFKFTPTPPVMLRKGTLSGGWVGTPYSLALGAAGGKPPYTWQVSDGSLPAGLELDVGGLISGIPAAAGKATFTLTVTGANNGFSTNEFSITILPNPALPLTEDFEHNGKIPGAWFQELVSGGSSWSFSYGSPNGRAPTPHGGAYNACMSVNTLTQSVARLVSPMLDFGAEAQAARVTFWHFMEKWAGRTDALRVYYKVSWESEWELVATYTDPVFYWTRRTLDLPAPSRTGYLAFEGTAQYGYGVCVDDVTIWDPTPPLGIANPDPLPSATVEIPYVCQLEGEGGVPPYTYAVTGGALPAGFEMNAAGLITGLSSNVQAASFTVQVADSENKTAVKVFNLGVALPLVDVYAEDFERGALMPLGWTQEFVTGALSWRFQYGGHYGHPPQPVSGNYNAFLFATWESSAPDKKTRLVSPWIDLGQVPGECRLTFWHCMEGRDSGQDQLRVLYKRSSADAWNLLATFTANVTEWTQRTMLLPDPSSTYRIAFEGNALSGYGVCIDDMRIKVSTAAPVILTDPVLRDGLTGIAYSCALEATGGAAPYSWTVVSNSLPPGLELGVETGVISGAPAASCVREFRVRVAGADGKASTKRFSLKIMSPDPMPFSEGFEHGGAMPEGWTIEPFIGTASWTFRAGSPLVNPKPAAAHGGQYNACFQGSQSTSKLVTPMLNLGTNTPNTKLTFWHCMAPYSTKQDWLNIYYRTHPTDAWQFLAAFHSSTPAWTERTVDLPNPTATYFIAFEALSWNGYGVCIDDIAVTGDFAPYANWQSLYFNDTELAAGLITGDEDDPDGDNIPNALEFAMGLDPRVHDTEGLPFGGVTAGYLTLSFRINKDADAAGVRFEVESCTDLLLQDWTTENISEQLPRADSNTWYQALHWHNVPVTNAPQRFMRFKVYMP